MGKVAEVRLTLFCDDVELIAKGDCERSHTFTSTVDFEEAKRMAREAGWYLMGDSALCARCYRSRRDAGGK